MYIYWERERKKERKKEREISSPKHYVMLCPWILIYLYYVCNDNLTKNILLNYLFFICDFISLCVCVYIYIYIYIYIYKKEGEREIKRMWGLPRRSLILDQFLPPTYPIVLPHASYVFLFLARLPLTPPPHAHSLFSFFLFVFLFFFFFPIFSAYPHLRYYWAVLFENASRRQLSHLMRLWWMQLSTKPANHGDFCWSFPVNLGVGGQEETSVWEETIIKGGGDDDGMNTRNLL